MVGYLREGLLSLKRYILCVGLVMASCSGALAANDGVPAGAPAGTADTAQGAVPAPAQAGTSERTDAPGTRTCRQAKAKSRPQLTPEQKAQRKAARQAMHAGKTSEGVAQGTSKAHKPRPAKAPLC